MTVLRTCAWFLPVLVAAVGCEEEEAWPPAGEEREFRPAPPEPGEVEPDQPGFEEGFEQRFENGEELKGETLDDPNAREQEVLTATARLEPTDGFDAHGTVRFVQQEDGVRVVAELAGLEPGLHGFHVHEHGDCTAPDASSAGGHYDPEGHEHALPPHEPRHAGDMGNIVADEEGRARLDETFDTFTVSGDHAPVVGRAVIVHAQPDTGEPPDGSAGPRVACGVIDPE